MTTTTVVTDLLDYAPGSTAVIVGTGFDTGETVELQVLHNDGTPNTGGGHEPWQVTDGSLTDLDGLLDGNIETTWYVNPDDSLDSSFDLTAAGLDSGLVATTAFTDSAVKINSLGTEFWLAFTPNHGDGGTQFITIAAPQAATGSVDIPGLGFSEAFDLTAGETTSIDLPSNVDITLQNAVSNLGIHVTSDTEVAVYGLNQQSATTDAYLGLPVDALGTEYMAMSYTALLPGQLAVVGTADETTVTITPTVTTYGRAAGVPYNITLNTGQTYLLSTDASGEDLTGTVVTSDKPVAVFSGVQCANVPEGVTYCDHLVEQMVPVETWGKSFVTSPLATRTGGDIFRVLAAEDGTQVTIDGIGVATLNSGEFYEASFSSTQYSQDPHGQAGACSPVHERNDCGWSDLGSDDEYRVPHRTIPQFLYDHYPGRSIQYSLGELDQCNRAVCHRRFRPARRGGDPGEFVCPDWSQRVQRGTDQYFAGNAPAKRA